MRARSAYLCGSRLTRTCITIRITKIKEIDAVIELADGQWCAFEIKLGANQIDTAAENLLKIKRQIEEDPRGKPPAVLCVLCGMSNAAYRRADGVFVVPITALKP